jgi:hypothetical protein
MNKVIDQSEIKDFGESFFVNPKVNRRLVSPWPLFNNKPILSEEQMQPRFVWIIYRWRIKHSRRGEKTSLDNKVKRGATVNEPQLKLSSV